MSHSIQFKWFNGQLTRRFCVCYEDATDLFDSLIKKMTQSGFVRAQENVFWIDSDGERILLEDGESMQVALNLHANNSVILLESAAAEDGVATGDRRTTSHGPRRGPFHDFPPFPRGPFSDFSPPGGDPFSDFPHSHRGGCFSGFRGFHRGGHFPGFRGFHRGPPPHEPHHAFPSYPPATFYFEETM
ncbi:hypothetical protein Tcan_05959 [Toxocara canis]|uniref:PB1 domain-containing protein n=2 Tax=Toxocara canis TaxID=6265 RepID=A0A0B2VIY3_TOXCA|nr:hypothetical protein Tcan_05959 [Toxocara canis]VDM41746.1 unnamed protein product [Toxocara canis]